MEKSQPLDKEIFQNTAEPHSGKNIYPRVEISPAPTNTRD